jgi:hypothetical protein
MELQLKLNLMGSCERYARALLPYLSAVDDVSHEFKTRPENQQLIG